VIYRILAQAVRCGGKKNPLIMHVALKTLALLSAASLPMAFFADFAGLQLPFGLGVSRLFNAFVFVLTLLTAGAEYSDGRNRPSLRSAPRRGLAQFEAPRRDGTESRLAA